MSVLKILILEAVGLQIRPSRNWEESSMNAVIGILTLLLAAATLYYSYKTYRFTRETEKKREEAERQNLKDEYDAMMENSDFPMSIEQREYFAKKSQLEKRLKRK